MVWLNVLRDQWKRKADHQAKGGPTTKYSSGSAEGVQPDKHWIQPLHGRRPVWHKRFAQQFQNPDFKQNVNPSISPLDGYFLARGRIEKPLEHALPYEPYGFKMTGRIGERSLNPKTVIDLTLLPKNLFVDSTFEL